MHQVQQAQEQNEPQREQQQADDWEHQLQQRDQQQQVQQLEREQQLGQKQQQLEQEQKQLEQKLQQQHEQQQQLEQQRQQQHQQQQQLAQEQQQQHHQEQILVQQQEQQQERQQELQQLQQQQQEQQQQLQQQQQELEKQRQQVQQQPQQQPLQPQQAPQTGADEGCSGTSPRLRFLRYESSKWEQQWLAHVKEWSASSTALCGQMQKDSKLAHTWAREAAAALRGCGMLEPALAANDQVFSRYVYEDVCTGAHVSHYIEPIAGLTRHPLAICLDGGGAQIVNRSYLVLGQATATCAAAAAAAATDGKPVPEPEGRVRAPGARLMLFDLGASLYTSGPGGDSQRWFVDGYTQHGARVAEYYAWEAQVLQPRNVWGQVPAALKPHYHWFNVPAETARDSMDNPWNVLRAVVKPEDYVVVKLDIDNTPVETEFMKQLQADPSLRALVDEMFFEHHVNVQPMWKWWHTEHEKVYLPDTYDMQLSLRKEGMRFHGWP